MPWKIAVIILLTIVTAYKLLLDIVQYRSAGNPTPKNVADIYDAETYQRWKNYNSENCRLRIVSNLISYVIMLVLLLTNAHAAFASLFSPDPAVQIIAVLLLEVIVDNLVDIPIQYVDTMVIEQKYGFNRTTVKTFIVDRIRKLLLGTAFYMGICFLLWGLYDSMGDWMLLLFATVMFLFTLFISFMYPIFSRLGNKFVPLEEGSLKDRLMELLNKHGYRVKAIEVMDASRRTTKLNAYFTGFGKMKTIVLYDNLLNAMSEEEICAIFAHELGHGLHKDVLKGQILNIGNMLVMSSVVWLAVKLSAVHTAFGFEGVNYGFVSILMGIGLGLVQPLMSLVINARSRKAEYRADRQAIKEGYGSAMITGLKKLAKDNFSHLAPTPALVVLEYSHPPISQRVEAITCELEKTSIGDKITE